MSERRRAFVSPPGWEKDLRPRPKPIWDWVVTVLVVILVLALVLIAFGQNFPN